MEKKMEDTKWDLKGFRVGMKEWKRTWKPWVIWGLLRGSIPAFLANRGPVD